MSLQAKQQQQPPGAPQGQAQAASQQQSSQPQGGSLAGVELAPSMLSAAGPAPVQGPSIPAGTGPGGTPTTALSVYPLIVQLCQRPDPRSIAAAAAAAGHNGTNRTGADGKPVATSADAQSQPGSNLPGSSAQRENALLELSKKREQYEDLALVLWHSFGEPRGDLCANAPR